MTGSLLGMATFLPLPAGLALEKMMRAIVNQVPLGAGQGTLRAGGGEPETRSSGRVGPTLVTRRIGIRASRLTPIDETYRNELPIASSSGLVAAVADVCPSSTDGTLAPGP